MDLLVIWYSQEIIHKISVFDVMDLYFPVVCRVSGVKGEVLSLRTLGNYRVLNDFCLFSEVHLY
jgi:hypothetical protein